MGRITNDMIAKAIPKSNGIISTIAKSCKADWHTVDKRVKKSTKLQRLIKDEKESVLDIAENQLIGKIENGEAWSIKYYLSTIGKGRGYVERQEVIDPKNQEIEKVRKQLKEMTNVARNKNIAGPVPGGRKASKRKDN